MTFRHDHLEIEELLAAYALDAVDGDEAEEISVHLRDCAQCSREVSAYREAAALLTEPPSEPSPTL
jgi:hypothetical protein